MSRITTPVLDTSLGKPAPGVLVTLSRRDDVAWRELGQATTDDDGRVRDFLPALSALVVGGYRLVFETAGYFRATSRAAFFERVTLEFHVADPSEHFHVPLLLTPFGYTTYRGS
jgi:5-hydroxyisourate hydrolase